MYYLGARFYVKYRIKSYLFGYLKMLTRDDDITDYPRQLVEDVKKMSTKNYTRFVDYESTPKTAEFIPPIEIRSTL